MESIYTKTLIRGVIIVAITTYVLVSILPINTDMDNLNKFVSDLQTAVSIDVVFWSIFFKWGWKWGIFYPWLVPFPNISGVWKGTIMSNWGNRLNNPIEAEIKIKQTYWYVLVSMKTNESKSNCISTSLNIDPKRNSGQLIYTYQNTPGSNVRKQSEIHFGTVILDFEGKKVEEMEGNYWTDRNTSGEIKLLRKQ